jgi:hypothetical protein
VVAGVEAEILKPQTVSTAGSTGMDALSMSTIATNGDVAIAVAGNKEQVTTAYGPSDPSGHGFNPASKWAEDPAYVEVDTKRTSGPAVHRRRTHRTDARIRGSE